MRTDAVEVDAAEGKAFQFARQMINLVSGMLVKMDRIHMHIALDGQREQKRDIADTLFLPFYRALAFALVRGLFRNAFCFLNAENEH